MPSASYCLFVCLEGRPGPRPRDRFRQRSPLRDLADAQVSEETSSRVLVGMEGLVLRGIDREGGGEALMKPPYDWRPSVRPSFGASPKGGWEGDGREVRGFPSSPLPVLT